MPDDVLPDSVRRFLADHIVSVEQLEILLLLNDDPKRSWSVDDVFHVIQSSRASVIERLESLAAQGLLKREDKTAAYQFAPASEELRSGVAAVGAAYRQWRVKVIETIFSQPKDQVRIFADAFKLRKDK